MWSRWAVQIVGFRIDIENLMAKLNASIQRPDDHFMSNIGETSCLRCAKWNSISSAEISAAAITDLARIRGCLDSLDSCGTLEIGTIFELSQSDKILQKFRDDTFAFHVLPATPDRQPPILLREMIRLAENDDYFNSSVMGFEGFPSWYSIYRAVEACLGLWGGLSAFEKQHPEQGSLIDRVKQTSNFYRHASVRYPYPKRPISIGQAQIETRKFIRTTFEMITADQPPDSFDTEVIFQIPNNSYPGHILALPQRRFEGGKREAAGVVGEKLNAPSVNWYEDWK
jgi:hypothetical protein